MENGQEQFLHYILSSVKEEYKKEAEELLLIAFKNKQIILFQKRV